MPINYGEIERASDLDKRRVVALAKCGLLLSTMAGEGTSYLDHDDSADLYNEVLMALGIEDEGCTDIALGLARDHPDWRTLVDDPLHVGAAIKASEERATLAERENARLKEVLGRIEGRVQIVSNLWHNSQEWYSEDASQFELGATETAWDWIFRDVRAAIRAQPGRGGDDHVSEARQMVDDKGGDNGR